MSTPLGGTGPDREEQREATLGPAIDDAALAELLALDRLTHNGLFERVVRMFLERSCELLHDMSSGISSNDHEQLFMSAHSLKSASANVGAMRLSSSCKQLEDLGRRGTTMGASDLLSQAIVLHQDASRELEMRLRTRQAHRTPLAPPDADAAST